MTKERILLVGGNYYPELTGIGKYNGEMMDWLSTNGYECGVVTTFPYYPFWKIQDLNLKKSTFYRKDHLNSFNGNPIKIHRCLHYVPAVPSGSKRIFSDLSFFISALLQIFVLLFKKKYDYVITVAPPFQLGLLGLLYKKIKGAKFIYHNQDLQIDAATELGMIKSKLLLGLMFKFERFIIRKADYVSSISEGMIKKIKIKYNRQVILFPNWTDTKQFYPIGNKEEIKKQYNFSESDKIVLYSGAIGEKQDLHTLIYCAKELSFRHDIKFVICGSGPYQQQLIDLAQQTGICNVIFMPLQPKEKFNQFLNMADLHLVLQKCNVSDIVMPSKLTTIFSVGGLALVSAQAETNLHTIISSNNIGLLIEPENHASLATSILNAIDQPHTELKDNARRYAEECLAVDKIIARFFAHITDKRGWVKDKMREPWQVDVNAN